MFQRRNFLGQYQNRFNSISNNSILTSSATQFEAIKSDLRLHRFLSLNRNLRPILSSRDQWPDHRWKYLDKFVIPLIQILEKVILRLTVFQGLATLVAPMWLKYSFYKPANTPSLLERHHYQEEMQHENFFWYFHIWIFPKQMCRRIWRLLNSWPLQNICPTSLGTLPVCMVFSGFAKRIRKISGSWTSVIRAFFMTE